MTLAEYKLTLIEERDMMLYGMESLGDSEAEKAERRGVIEGLEFALKLLYEIKETN